MYQRTDWGTNLFLSENIGPGAFYQVIQSRLFRVRDWAAGRLAPAPKFDYITCLRLEEAVLNYLEQLEKLEKQKNTGLWHVVSPSVFGQTVDVVTGLNIDKIFAAIRTRVS